MFRLKHTEDGVLKEGAQAVLDNMDEVHKINILNTREKIKQSRIDTAKNVIKKKEIF